MTKSWLGAFSDGVLAIVITIHGARTESTAW